MQSNAGTAIGSYGKMQAKLLWGVSSKPMQTDRTIALGSTEKAAGLPSFRLLGATLSKQFLVAGGLLMLFAMVIVGLLIGQVVSRDIIRNRAISSALFMQSMTGPLVAELETSPTLSSDAINKLDGVLNDDISRQRFPHLEIWTPDGTVVYSRSKGLIGKKFELPEGLKRALSGEIAAEYADLSAAEHVTRRFDTRYLEVYSPLRSQGSDKIIAVAEIHEQETVLQEDLRRAWFLSWGIVAVVTSLIMAGLFTIVHRGSRLITDQGMILKRRAEEAENTSDEVRRLKDRAQRATARIAELNEHFLRTIGADLHDGPSQLLAFVALQIENLRLAKTAADRKAVTQVIASSVDDALQEIRAIARQLVLPDINNLSVADIIQRVVKLHRARTGVDVTSTFIGDAQNINTAVKICAFRFLQEGMNNAHRHAASNGLQIDGNIDEASLRLAIIDAGPPAGFTPPLRVPEDTIGLHGLRERIESLGGSLSISQRENGGTRLEMLLDLTGGLNLDYSDIRNRH